MNISQEYIIIHPPAYDATTVINLLADLLYEDGAVSADYGAQTLDREARHPTGLPTAPIPIAIPHADATGVHRSSLAVALLAQPVIFRNMGDPDQELPVEIVLLLANRNPDEQVDALRRLATLFGQPDKLVELRSLTSSDTVASWLRQKIQGTDRREGDSNGTHT